jgi:tetratricopeptide (TPR) repeat protein
VETDRASSTRADRAPPGRGAPPLPRTPFVGREEELHRLRNALERAEAGAGSVVLVSGEPGIGKSRLLDEVALAARDGGARVLLGRCWEAGGAPAYWPWIQCLRAYVREVDRETLADQLSAHTADLAQILPEIRSLVPDLPEPPAVDPETSRFRLFDATTGFLMEVARDRALLLVMDDLHAADAPSLLLLRFLAASIGTTGVLVAGAYRDIGLPAGHPLSEAVVELDRSPDTQRLRLGGLNEADVGRYIELAHGVPAPALAAAVQDETEGNPLFIGELVRLLATEGRLEEGLLAPGERTPLPETVRDVIARRLDHLSARTRDVLVLASVLGREFSIEAVRRLGGMSTAGVLRALDEAGEARIVLDAPAGLGRLRFSHALVRDALYDGIPPPRRYEFHRRAAEVLEALHAGEIETHLSEIAHHAFEAAPSGDPRRAVDLGRRAGERAVTLVAYEEAARLYGMALESLSLAPEPDAALRCDLLLALGDARMKAGDADEARTAFLKAADLAREIHDPDSLATAALGYGGRFVWVRAGSDPHLIPLLEEALLALPPEDSPLRVRVLARLAGALRVEASPEARDRKSEEAVRMARRLGDRPSLAYALVARYACIWGPHNTGELRDIAEEALRLARDSGEGERELEAQLIRHTSYLILGELGTARTALEAAADLAQRLKQVIQGWYVASYRTIAALFEGRLREAETMIEETRELGRRAQDLDPEVAYRIQLFSLRLEQGRVGEVETLIRRSIDEYPWYPLFRCALARLHTELGRERQARTTFEDVARDGFSIVPRDNQWLFAMSLLPETAAFLGDRLRSETLHDLLEPFAGLNVLFAPEITTGSVARPAAVAATAAGRWERAERLFEVAVERNDEMGARPWATRSRLGFARMLLDRDGPGDRDRAARLLEEAAVRSAKLGASAIESDVARLRELLGPGQKATPEPVAAVFRREGDSWELAFEGRAVRLRDSKGLRYLHALVAAPDREIPALELASPSGSGATPEAGLHVESGHAGQALDERARREYMDRIRELEEEAEEAEGLGDRGRAGRARDELDFLSRELASAYGLGGRPRRASDTAERARKAVTNRIRDAILRIRAEHPALARHLGNAVRTGTFCSYRADRPVNWSL